MNEVEIRRKAAEILQTRSKPVDFQEFMKADKAGILTEYHTKLEEIVTELKASGSVA
jgi:hypothetical protein